MTKLIYSISIFTWLSIGLLNPTPAAASETGKSLHITPNTCIKNKDQTFCSLKVNIQVSFEQVTDFCVLAKRLDYKKCYLGLKELNQNLELQLKEDVYFQLTDSKEELIAAQMLSVAILKPKKARPRRNLGWILF